MWCARKTAVDGWRAGTAGDQGYADVATTSLRPLDEGHLKAAAALDAAPRSRAIPGPFSRALDAVARSAADAAKGSDPFASMPKSLSSSHVSGQYWPPHGAYVRRMVLEQKVSW